jgi:hypothetical protein
MWRMALHMTHACTGCKFAFQVLALLAAGHQNYEPQPGMSAAVGALVASSTTADPAPASFRLGQGVWEVHDQSQSCPEKCRRASTVMWQRKLLLAVPRFRETMHSTC